MDSLNDRDVCEVVNVEDEGPFRSALASHSTGIVIAPQPYGPDSRDVITPEGGDFAKWLSQNHPSIQLRQEPAERLVQRDADLWLPLVFLATDVTLPFYLNLVASYVHDRLKGALRGDRLRVRLAVEFLDSSTGSVKRFNFEGDAEALKDTIKQLQLKKLLAD